MTTRAPRPAPNAGTAPGAWCDLDGGCALPVAQRGVGVRLGVGLLVVGQSMTFGLALNLHDDVPPDARALTQWLILAGTVLVALLLGGPLVRAAWGSLARGRLTIEALFLLTTTGALAASLQAHLTGRGKIYYEVVSVLLVVYTVGRLIGDRSRAAALAGAGAWGSRLCVCRLVEGGGTRAAPVTDVVPGDLVEVWPGELIGVDGVVHAGVGFVAEAAVTGEPFAVVRRPGDRVLAGAACCDATLRIAATAKGTERQVDRLLAAVAAARATPVALQARADAIGRWFLPLVVATALGTFAYWAVAAGAGWEAALFNAMSVLLVACPCVIGLATPVVVWSALARLAERGVAVHSGDAVERLAAVDRVMFDKTGTLTEDRFALVDVETAPGVERAWLLGRVALVQERSTHPAARPFARLPRHFAPGAEPRVTAFVAVPGCGVRAELEEPDGRRHEIRVGTAAWLPGTLPGRAAPAGHRVHVGLDGELVAVAAVAERLRDSAPQALAHFARLGLPVEVLTGDTPDRAEALGLPPARGGLLPDDKRALVEAAKRAGGKPLFVGDGINDAPALAAAEVGVALASGAELAVGAAPVTLCTDDLRVLPWAIEVSRDAVRAVRRNLYRALAYNLVGMALAAGGALHPVVAALLMVVSSLTLIYSSTRVGIARTRPTPTAPLPARRDDSGAERSAAVSSRAVLGPTPPTPLPTVGRGAGGVGLLAAAHALAVALQGVVFLLLFAPLREPLVAALVLGAFAACGAGLACVWRRCAVPHRLDMCFGMLTLGNLGMLLGWWADAGFTALPEHACCRCLEASLSRPWMWVGMLALGNVAMRWCGRTPAPAGCHSLAMYTGGTVGMALGMAGGGWAAAQVECGAAVEAAALSFAGMTVGMLAGMDAGTRLAERVIGGLRMLGLLPAWPRLTSERTA